MNFMVFARMSTWRFKSGKREEAFLILDNILNTLTRQSEGFRGYMSLLSHEDPNKAVILTLWLDEEALEASEKGVFANAAKKIQNSLENSPSIENFRVFSTELFQRSKE
jgi:heme-degrading monooxygenase HmoA